ncbi:DUF4192 domain-containing protein [Streptomyces longisporoflavus]|uniref:DUF4192 domain-containing protein n=1 Tax=Streptomyces longisporoflavus TaxID=28044 RepID=A0ABW7QWB9_9ACTN
MTNHSEQNDPIDTDNCPDAVSCSGAVDSAGSSAVDSTGQADKADKANRADDADKACPSGSVGEALVTLRTPAELADALPYLLGFRPEESVVLIALHGERGRLGGRVRLGIPGRAEDWPPIAEQLAQCLVGGCERRGARPDGIIAFLCAEPEGAESGRQVMERLRPLAQVLRTACGSLDVPVYEVVCISAGSFWTYCCPDGECCPPEGVPLLRPGTSVLAAATAYAGAQVGVTTREMRARLMPWDSAAARDQKAALDAAGVAIVRRIMEEGGHAEVAADTLDLARRIMGRMTAAPLVSDRLEADLQDDELMAHDEAAALILGLQDRTTRDQAAEWMEGDIATPALRLWRALARRCVGTYGEHAAAPLSLAGWVAWSLGDTTEGQEALDMALCADPNYTFAQLLHHACAGDLDPEPIRRCLRGERTGRDVKGGQADLPLTTEPLNPEKEPVGAAPRRRRPARPKSGSAARSTDRPSTAGPQNRRRTIRRAARNDT